MKEECWGVGEEGGIGVTAARERKLGSQYCWHSSKQEGIRKVIPATKFPPMPCVFQPGSTVYGWKVKLKDL